VWTLTFRIFFLLLLQKIARFWEPKVFTSLPLALIDCFDRFKEH